MPFENVDCIRPASSSAAKVPADGVAVASRHLGMRSGGVTRYIRLTIGADLARKISLTQPEHGLRVLFGTGSDAGKVQISVDNEAGRFRARRGKGGQYALSINAATADGLFALEFPAFTRGGLEAIRPQNGQPPHFVFKASAEMLAVDD